MQQRVVIWGASSHAMVVADIIRAAATYEVAGFLDDVNPARHGTEFFGATILGGEEQLDVLRRARVSHLIVGVGHNGARLRLSGVARAKGYSLAEAIHPAAVIARGVPIGEGTAVCAGAIVNPGSVVGENVIIGTGATVDHECVIKDGSLVNMGARLAGRVTVGRASSVEIGAIVARQVTVGDGSVVGAGSVVLHDIPAGVLAYGTPARVVRKVQPDG